MFRLKLNFTYIAMLIAGIIVLTSLAGSLVYRLLSGNSISINSNQGVLASACTPEQKSDKIYFVSCGGTF